jgi:hypothetical protein
MCFPTLREPPGISGILYQQLRRPEEEEQLGEEFLFKPELARVAGEIDLETDSVDVVWRRHLIDHDSLSESLHP